MTIVIHESSAEARVSLKFHKGDHAENVERLKKAEPGIPSYESKRLAAVKKLAEIEAAGFTAGDPEFDRARGEVATWESAIKMMTFQISGLRSQANISAQNVRICEDRVRKAEFREAHHQ